jgi:hypothetical protein
MLVEAMRHAPAGAAATLACFVDVRGEPQGRPCFVVFLQIVHGLALYGRRRMRVGSERWPILTHDEVAFLRCVEAALRNDEAALAAHVTWLVRGFGARDFTAYVRTLASLIREPVFGDMAAAGAPVAQIGAGIDRPVAKRPARTHAAPAFPIAIK